jgi:hypothetical protein
VAAGHSGASGKNSSMVLYPFVALTDLHQVGKMEFHSSFDLARRNVVTTRFQTLRHSSGRAKWPRDSTRLPVPRRRGSDGGLILPLAKLCHNQPDLVERNL